MLENIFSGLLPFFLLLGAAACETGCWSKVSPGCVRGRNIGRRYHKTTLKECKDLCSRYSICLSIEFGVSHGGVRKVYRPGDCQLNSGNDTRRCDGKRNNLDLHLKTPCPFRQTFTTTYTGQVISEGGNADGALCHFPFLYKGKEHNECIKSTIKSSRTRYWCSTTYDGTQYGYCKTTYAEGANYQGTVNYNSLCSHIESHDEYSEPVCLDDNYFYQVYCYEYLNEKIWDWVWNTTMPRPVTKCPPGTKCGCKSQVCDATDVCHHISGFPVFPQHGLLSYTGNMDGNDNYGNSIVPWNGTVAKDEYGHFFREWLGYSSGYMQFFELIQPENGKFIKYQGVLGSGKCSTSSVASIPPLFSTYHKYSNYRKNSEGIDENGLQTQEWVFRYNWNDGTYDKAFYTYVKDGEVFIPLKYHHYFQYDGADRMDTKNFVYSNAIRDNSIFNVKKYCHS